MGLITKYNPFKDSKLIGIDLKIGYIDEILRISKEANEAFGINYSFQTLGLINNIDYKLFETNLFCDLELEKCIRKIANHLNTDFK